MIVECRGFKRVFRLFSHVTLSKIGCEASKRRHTPLNVVPEPWDGPAVGTTPEARQTAR